jgi:cell division septum initiation protein DivIVA
MTLEIDDDVFFAAHRLARRNGGDIGRELSNLARRGLETRAADGAFAGSTAGQQIIEEAQQRADLILQDAHTAANAMLMEYHAQAQRMWDEVNERIRDSAKESDYIGE